MKGLSIDLRGKRIRYRRIKIIANDRKKKKTNPNKDPLYHEFSAVKAFGGNEIVDVGFYLILRGERNRSYGAGVLRFTGNRGELPLEIGEPGSLLHGEHRSQSGDQTIAVKSMSAGEYVKRSEQELHVATVASFFDGDKRASAKKEKNT